MTFRGFEVRRVDYITRPISPPIVLARVRTQLALKAAADFLRDKNEYLAAQVARLTRQSPIVQDASIMAMASLAETRDHEPGNPPSQHYLRALALDLRKLPKYAAVLDDAAVDLLFKAAPLHDIGKVGRPPAPRVARCPYPGSYRREDRRRGKAQRFSRRCRETARQEIGLRARTRAGRQPESSRVEKCRESKSPPRSVTISTAFSTTFAQDDLDNAAARIREIIQAFNVLETNPLIGRPAPVNKRELSIGRRSRGYVALYRYVPEIDTAFILAVRTAYPGRACGPYATGGTVWRRR